MLRQTGVDGVTAARGSIGNPWIFRQAQALLNGDPLPAAPSVFEQREVMLEHFRLAEQIYPGDQVSRQMRKFGIRYALSHPLAEQVRVAFIAVQNSTDWQQVLSEWYAEDLPGRYPDQSAPAAATEIDSSCELR